jgi:hypothetical protein
MSDKLEKGLRERFKGDWRQDLRADVLFWIIHLAETGLESKRKDFRKADEMDASAAASLGSWSMDLDNLVAKAIASPLAKKTK